ncbi:MAG TPA: FUSC family protein [Opitutaceae bacterium]|nr:FUSC family protein [Opitutaceae bacterium]
MRVSFFSAAHRVSDYLSLQPDLSRAGRATLAFMVPLLLALAGWISIEVSFAAMAAQSLAIVDLRGDYRVRLALVLCMAAVLVGGAALGAATSGNLYAAVVATALMAAMGGLWRHLSSEFGPPLAISSTFVFLYALGAPPAPGAVGHHVVAALAGAAWGVTLQIAQWPFRPQHGLRRAVADTWVAVSDLLDAITPEESAGGPERADRIRVTETALRATIDAAYAMLGAARAGPIRERLEALNLVGARLATRVSALHSALDAAVARPQFAEIALTLEPALVSLANLSRGAAVAVVSRQPGQLATFEVRLRRLTSLLRVVRARLTASPGPEPGAAAQLAELIRQIEEHLPAVQATLRATIDSVKEPAASSLELLDLRALALRPLASTLNLNLRFDPALLRYTFRLAVFTVGGVIAFKLIALPHGYWLPFTIVVVLQPDYGSTRQRAAQRMLGTLAGGIAASAMLWLRLPEAAVLAAAAATMFAFGYWLKRNYAVAMFFITLFIVLLTGMSEPITFRLTVERLASTVAGGLLALLAAQLFWPVWERDRFPPILAAALQANRDYLRMLVARLAAGGGFDDEAVLAKRRAENANSAAFSSLRRLSGDPADRRAGLEAAATLANGNQRLTRALNGLALHLAPGRPLTAPSLERFAALASDTLDAVAGAVAPGAASPARAGALVRELESHSFPPTLDGREQWIFAQLTRAATELGALLVAQQEAAPARNAEPPAR